MAGEHEVKVITPSTLDGNPEQGPFPLELFTQKFLAQGDSWFSIGAIPPGLTRNILEAPIVLSESTVVVNCARPGKLLAHMGDTVTDPAFARLIKGRLSMKWDALLFSGGGNDLIDAASVGPEAPVDKRLFLTPAERGTGALAPAQYLSEDGWTTLSNYLTTIFGQLIGLRDAGKNAGIPTFFHSYAFTVPRNAPAGPFIGPWLHPAMRAYSIPEPDRVPVTSELLERLGALFAKLIADRVAADPACNLHLVDTLHRVTLVQPDPNQSGTSGDYCNEIHPTTAGYKKLAAEWSVQIETVL